MGYKLHPDNENPKRNIWVPDPDRQHIAEEMFECYDKGMTFQGIAARLNDLGWKPQRAKYWNSRTVSQILRNPAYGGMQGTVNRRDRMNVRKVKLITFLDQNLWKRVYEATDPTKVKKAGGPRRKNPLTGKVFCSVCGEPAHTVSGYLNIPRYRCRGYKSKVCTFDRTAYIQHLEWAVIRQAQDCIVEEGIENLCKRIIEERLAEDREKLESVQPLYDRLMEQDKAEERLLDLAEAGGETIILSKRLTAISREREAILEQIESHGVGVVPISYEDAHAELMEKLKGFSKNIRQILPQIERIEIVGQNEVKVWMFGWEIDIDLNEWTSKDKPATHSTPDKWLQ